MVITFTEDDFRANEFDPLNRFSLMPVIVTKNIQIANPIALNVVPLTVEQAQATTPLLLPENIPVDNRFSPPYAGNTIILVLHSHYFEV